MSAIARPGRLERLLDLVATGRPGAAERLSDYVWWFGRSRHRMAPEPVPEEALHPRGSWRRAGRTFAVRVSTAGRKPLHFGSSFRRG